LIVPFTKKYLKICFLFSDPNFTIVIIPVQVAWSLWPVRYNFPRSLSGVWFDGDADVSYHPTMRQGFPDRIVLMACKFSRFLLYTV
jgi:hypothetical protein